MKTTYSAAAVAMLAAASVAGIPAMLAQTPPAPPTPPEPPKARARSSGARVIMNHPPGSYLGIGCADLDAERAKALNLREVRGVEVKSVNSESPAAKAGLKEGDVVLEYNGQRVEGTAQLQRMVRETPPGREVKLNISRNGNPQTITATIGTAKNVFFQNDDGSFTFQMPELPRIPPITVGPDMPRFEMSWRNPTLGVETESLSPQLAEFFGVKEGVLVRSVIAKSAAEKAGIKAGDVIIKVDDAKVSSAREVTSVLRSTVRSKRTFPLVLVRNKKEMTVTVTMEEKKSSETFTRAGAKVEEQFRQKMQEFQKRMDEVQKQFHFEHGSGSII